MHQILDELHFILVMTPPAKYNITIMNCELPSPWVHSLPQLPHDLSFLVPCMSLFLKYPTFLWRENCHQFTPTGLDFPRLSPSTLLSFQVQHLLCNTVMVIFIFVSPTRFWDLTSWDRKIINLKMTTFTASCHSLWLVHFFYILDWTDHLEGQTKVDIPSKISTFMSNKNLNIFMTTICPW